MNSSFQRRLDQAKKDIEQLPPRRYTEAETREWADRQLAELMAEFKLSRGKALALANEHAPLIAQWCGVSG